MAVSPARGTRSTTMLRLPVDVVIVATTSSSGLSGLVSRALRPVAELVEARRQPLVEDDVHSCLASS